MRNLFVYSLKCCAALIVSVILLSVFSMFYYHPPVAVQQPDGTTNFKYIPNKTWSYMTEGLGFGKTDNLGYNNAYYNNLTEPDIVVAGSSHMEALEVPQNANCVYLMNEMFDKDDIPDNNYKCLNLGISGHSFQVVASNYKFIASKFQGAKYVVIEACDVMFSSQTLDDIIAEKYSSPMEEKSFLSETMQKVPFVRALYKKINETKPLQTTPAESTDSNNVAYDLKEYTDKLNVVLSKIAEISAENHVQPIVLLHDRFWENEEDELVFATDKVYRDTFKKCCYTNGIKVIDVSSKMVNTYKNKFSPSYGFANSAPGDGHLNKTGHRIIAETVYEYITEMEESK